MRQRSAFGSGAAGGILALVVGLAACVETARGSSLTPTSAEGAARQDLGDRLPNAKLLWVNGTSIYCSPVKNWSPQFIVSGSNPRWSPDGSKILFFQGSNSLWMMDSDFTNAREILSGANASSGSAPGTASWTRDGAAVCTVASDAYRVLKYELASGTTTTIYDARQSPYNGLQITQGGELRTGGRFLLAFTAQDGHHSFIVDLQQQAYIYNSDMWRGDCSPAWAPDGSYALQTARTSNRPVLKSTFNASVPSVSSATRFFGADDFVSSYYIHGQRVSNDGQWLVCGVLFRSTPYNGNGSSGNREIFCWKLGEAESNAVRLTFDTGEDKTPDLYVAPADSTQPSTPTGLSANADSESEITLTWSASSDPESGVSSYSICRDGSKVGSTSNLTYTDSGLTEGTSYTYRVSAVNGAGLESSQSSSVTESTLADTTPPAIDGLTAAGVDTQVVVVFSEPVSQSTAENTSSYDIDHSVSISGAALAGDLKTVTLATSALSEGITYTLTVNNVQDRATTPNTIAPNTTSTFEFVAVAGLVLHYELDDGSGWTAVDSSPSGNNGTVSDATWTTGKIGGALAYTDGDTLAVDTPVDIGSEWSFCAWFTAPVPSSGGWQSMTRAPAGLDDHQVLVSSSLQLGTYLNSGGGFHGTGYNLGGLSAGWHHLAAVASGSTTDFYMDGQHAGTANAKSTSSIGNIGSISTGAQRFSDTVDDVRIYNRALSLSEIQAIYACSSGGNQAPVVNAGPDQTMTLPASAHLSGTATDDGLPGGTLTTTWTKVSGPGAVSFNDASATDTMASFSAPGSYVLRLTAYDGALASSDEVTVTVQILQESITVVAPNGGEVLYIGRTCNIRWTTVGVEDVTIMYSTDGGSTWADVEFTVDTNSPDWGDCPWTVPATPSADCLVMIETYGGGADDRSDGAFEIRTEGLDADSDGLPDSWEETHFGSIDECDPGADDDGDGLTNAEEYAAGSDPWDPDTDGDGLLDGDDHDPAKAPLPFTGFEMDCGAGISFVWVLLLLAIRRRRGR